MWPGQPIDRIQLPGLRWVFSAWRASDAPMSENEYAIWRGSFDGIDDERTNQLTILGAGEVGA